MTLRNITQLDAIHFPEIEDVPVNTPEWALLPESLKTFITTAVDTAQKSRALAMAYQELFRETEALRAERDGLLARSRGWSPTAH